MTPRYWILDEQHRPQPATAEQWATWFETNRSQLWDKVANGCFVSTIFNGCPDVLFNLQHWEDPEPPQAPPPRMFETIVFDPPNDRILIGPERVDTWEKAQETHARLLAEAQRIANG